MALDLTPVTAVDSNSQAIPGGLMAGKPGSGPTFLFHGIVDGIDGENYAQVDANNRLSVLALIDSSQLGNLGPQVPAAVPGVCTVSGGDDYREVDANQTDIDLGAAATVGDYLHKLICVVTTAATSQVSVRDGSGGDIILLPNNVGAGVGTYEINVGWTSKAGGWSVTTAAGVAVKASGVFTDS